MTQVTYEPALRRVTYRTAGKETSILIEAYDSCTQAQREEILPRLLTLIGSQHDFTPERQAQFRAWWSGV